MTKESRQSAKREAKRVIALIEAVDKAEDRDRWFIGTKATGALRRASMDLTRALADMRRPG